MSPSTATSRSTINAGTASASLLLSVFVAVRSSSEVSAWMPTSSPLARGSRSTMAAAPFTSSTRLFMFDWMNPNKKSNEKKSDDFFGNMFNINNKEAEPKEEVVAASVVAATTVDLPATIEKTEEEKKEDFVAASFNAEEAAEVAEKVEAVEKVQESVTSAIESQNRSPSVSYAPVDNAIHHGKVRWFDTTKGYGFLSEVDKNGKYLNPTQEEDEAIFVHQSVLQVPNVTMFRRLYHRELVDFRLEKDEHGRLKATHVTGMGGTPLRVVDKQKSRQDLGNPEAP